MFSSARVIIEHVNGMLKARFASLKGIRIQVRVVEDFQRINDWITVCLIIHNLLIDFREDDWDEDIENEDDDNEEAINSNIVDQPAGMNLRIKVQTELLRWFFNN